MSPDRCRQCCRSHPQVTQRLLAVPMQRVCISAITAGELAFGLAKRPDTVALKAAVQEFLHRVDLLPWNNAVAQIYGSLRAQLQAKGTPLAPLDTQIAAHALQASAILVSNEQAFQLVNALHVEEWCRAAEPNWKRIYATVSQPYFFIAASA